MGKGYGRYWITALGVAIPFLAFGVWRLIDGSRGLPHNEAVQYWVRTGATTVILVALTAVALTLIALPYTRALLRARREHPSIELFLVRRSDDLARSLDELLAGRKGARGGWTYWILTEVSESGIRFRERPSDPTSGVFVSAAAVIDMGIGTSRTNGLPVPALRITVDGVPVLSMIPSNGAFMYTWGEERIAQEITRLDDLFGTSSRGTRR